MSVQMISACPFISHGLGTGRFLQLSKNKEAHATLKASQKHGMLDEKEESIYQSITGPHTVEHTQVVQFAHKGLPLGSRLGTTRKRADHL